MAKAKARQIGRIFWMSRRVDTSKALTYESGSILTGKPAKPASVANSNKNKQTQTNTNTNVMIIFTLLKLIQKTLNITLSFRSL